MRNLLWLPAALLSTLTSIVLPGVLQAADENPALPTFALDQPGEHVFHFRQAQMGWVTLMLEVEGTRQGERDRQELTRLGLTIEATLTNRAGRTVCHAIGSPGDGMSNEHWVVRFGGGEAAFWHKGCAEVKLKRSQPYTLTVRLLNVNPKTPRIVVTPTLERSDDYQP